MAETNWKNRTIWTADNLEIMRGMNSDSVDLIYLDPPFNSNANYAAPIGSKAAGSEFKDTWSLSDLNVKWLDLLQKKPQQAALWRVIQAAQNNSDKSYLIYMAIRLLEMHRLLKENGSIYLHCDPTMSHYLKLLMDAVFGRREFRNEIVWCYTGPSNTKRWFPRKHDTILFFGGEAFNADAVRTAYSAETLARRGRIEGTRSVISPSVNTQDKRSIEDVRAQFGDGKIPEDWWSDVPVLTNQRERVGYPTQKPLALLERIIKASSNEGDVVLDPFCGCATTLVAADRLGRNWVGIDISPIAVRLVNERIKADQPDIFVDVTDRVDIPLRTDLGKLPPYNSLKNKKILYGEQGGYCHGCEEHFQMQNLEVDHITPTSKGGTNHIENLQLLCSYCNSLKGNRTQEYLISRLAGMKALPKLPDGVNPDA
ncbi:MAG: DNA methyltransferase [Gammaproteobacteria bacterium]|nr:DNA methyltransferase [Gammaproteobacteria bacterium]